MIQHARLSNGAGETIGLPRPVKNGWCACPVCSKAGDPLLGAFCPLPTVRKLSMIPPAPWRLPRRLFRLRSLEPPISDPFLIRDTRPHPSVHALGNDFV